MTVLVVGGGIAGLAAAYTLGRSGIPTLLLEGSGRLGGKIRTESTDGFVIEHGPDSFVGYRPAAIELVGELGLAGEIIRPLEPRSVSILTTDGFRRFPDGMGLVLPTRIRPFITSDLFSPVAKLRMAADLVLRRDPRSGDIGVGPFLRRRLGRALVDRLAGPLIGGVYGTAIDDLSLDAVVPQLRASERRYRSLLVAAVLEARTRGRSSPTGGGGASSPFVSLRPGIGGLCDALELALRAMPSVTIRTNAGVAGLEGTGTGVTLRLPGGELLHGEAVILATPAPITAGLLDAVAPAASAPLRGIRHGSTAVVNLAYRARDVPDTVAGHGYLVADDVPGVASGVTLSSRKWAGRAPEEALLVRAFIGDARATARALPDDALIEAAHADVGGRLGVRGRPVLSRVSRYGDAMPHYTVGHLDRVAATEAALAAVPQIRIAGSAYRGVGLPDCIAQGRVAANAILTGH